MAYNIAPEAFVRAGQRWTDNAGSGSGGSTTSLGSTGGVVAWSLAGAGLVNQTGQDFFSGASVSLASFLGFDYVSILRGAFDAWSAVGNIEFIQIADGGGNIGAGSVPTIRIAGGYVDGAAELLGRAYFPASNPRGGDIVFDSGEPSFWDAHSFFLVAMHEIGHALGLDHETVEVALMNPVIDLNLTGLTVDDVNGIRAIYGAQDFGPNVYYMPAGQANLTLIDPAPSLTINGNGLNNIIYGSWASETLSGVGGNDTLVGDAGNDTIDGGVGIDTAVFSGLRSAYTIAPFASGIRVSGPDGIDTLTSVERLAFDNVTVSQPATDFSGDFRGDLLWQNTNGQPHIWLMSGTTIVGQANAGGNPGPSWHVKDAGDFNNDGRADILWQNDNGQAAIWLMNGTSQISGPLVGANPGPTWHEKAAADFNGDGKADILWQNDNGQAHIWTMNGTSITSQLNAGGNPGPSWHVNGAGDFNADGKDDILWQNDNGQAVIWLMNGATPFNQSLGNPGPTWHEKAAADFNGDGRADILWQNDNGQAHIWLMNGATILSQTNAGGNPGPSWHVKDAGDFNGDGMADIAWQNDNGQADIWLMNGTTPIHQDLVGGNPGVDWHLIA